MKTLDVNGISKASAFVCFAQFGEQLQLNMKPGLTGSEACHRLALSEGQKENKWKREFPYKMEEKNEEKIRYLNWKEMVIVFNSFFIDYFSSYIGSTKHPFLIN